MILIKNFNTKIIKINKLFYNNFTTTFKKNPYNILNLSPNATLQQIKKSYRSIAHQYHPDKNTDIKAQQIFVQAKQAYEILIDEDKRKQYDNDHNIGQNRNYGFDKNPFDEFNDDFYRDKSRVYHENYTAGSKRKFKGQNIMKEIKITFLQSVIGLNCSVEVQKKSTCPMCNGNRCKPGTAPTRCLSCGGSGTTIHRQGSMVMHLQCARCQGVGLMIKNPCGNCKAKGILMMNIHQNIQIQSGVENEQIITFKEKGHQSQNGPNGDLIIKILVEKHHKFRKLSWNIHAMQWITISQATLGYQKQIDTIWGKQIIQIPAGTKDGSHIVIKNQGIRHNSIGHHVAVIRIQVPTSLTNKQRQIFMQLAKQQNPIDENQIHNEDYIQTNQSSDLFNKFKNMFK